MADLANASTVGILCRCAGRYFLCDSLSRIITHAAILMTPLFACDHLNSRRLARRRFTFFSAVFVLTCLGIWFMSDLLWRDGVSPSEIPILVLFSILFAHISSGFFTAL